MRRRDDKFPDNGFEAWGGYMNAKIAKLEEQFCDTSEKEENKLTDIFKGVSIYVNGFTFPSADELKEIMRRHGGVYHTYQRSEDFIIASNLPDTKVKNMCLSKVVKPEWITNSIASNHLLDYKDYLLYRNYKNQPRLNFNIIKNKQILTEKQNIKTDDTLFDTISNTIEPENVDSIRLNDLDALKNSKQENSKTSNEVKRSDQSTKTAADPNFISEFYSNSRLHHISQLGAYFKQHVNDLRENSNFEFPARDELKSKIMRINGMSSSSDNKLENDKAIMHIDMDCFFVSVGLRKRPDLIGKPVAVTHSKGGQGRQKRPGVDRATEFNLYKEKQAKKLSKNMDMNEDEILIESRVDNITDEDDKYGSMSEIASCSYEARAKGIGNGMFMGAALRLCPDLLTIPYDFDGYKEVAYVLYNTIAQYTLDIEAVSCDEMYVDCTELLNSINVSAQDFAAILREEIKGKTGCPCSTGFGGNRLQARLATKRAKPNGQFFLTSDLVEDYMFDIKLRDLPGVGRQISYKLESLGHSTCGSLQTLSLASLQRHLGVKTGAQLFDQCRGRDSNPLTFLTIRKSVSAEVNYGIRFENNEQCADFLRQLSAEVQSRMQQFKVLGKCITLKLMVRAEEAPVETAKFMGHGYCNVINKSTSLITATNNADIIAREVISLCNKLNIKPKEMRGIGIQITKLEAINNKKNSKGAIGKFLTSNVKLVKPEIKKDNLVPPATLPNNSSVNAQFKSPITPQKATCSSPRKKSPIIGTAKSPTGKRRGRPPKNTKIHISTPKYCIDKFIQGSTNINSLIKKEIEVKEVVSEPVKKVDKPQPQGLMALPWNKVRDLLQAWLDSGQVPKVCDIKLIAAYMRDMVINKNIDKLYILLNYLRRRTREIDSQVWIEVYEYIEEEVQSAMVAVYGKKIWTNG